jgi:hypothetical protein
MHAIIHRFQNRTSEVPSKVNETLMPKLNELDLPHGRRRLGEPVERRRRRVEGALTQKRASARKHRHGPTVAWVESMVRRLEVNGIVSTEQVAAYRAQLLEKHGLPMQRSGRSERGNLRKFAGMSPRKFVAVFWQVQLEGNDPQALVVLEAELETRLKLARKATTLAA